MTPRTVAYQAPLSLIASWNLLKLMSIESIMPSKHLNFCHPLLSCPLCFPTSESFPVSWFLASGSQSIGVSISASVLPINIHSWFSLGLTGLISLQSKGLSSLLQHHSSEASVFLCSAFFMREKLSHPYMTTGKTIALTRWTFVGRVNVSAFWYAI